MDVAKVTTKGQVTIPKEVRENLNLRTGSKLVFVKRGSDWIVFNPDQDPTPLLVTPLDESGRDRLLRELSAQYKYDGDLLSHDTQDIGTILNRLQDAFDGVAEDLGWKTDQDVVEYIKSLRRSDAE